MVAEDYYVNEFLNRFSAIKMLDNTLYISSNLANEQKDYYRSFQLTRLISILPQPVLSFFGFSISAKERLKLSSADLLLGFYSGRIMQSRLTGSFMSTCLSSIRLGFPSCAISNSSHDLSSI